MTQQVDQNTKLVLRRLRSKIINQATHEHQLVLVRAWPYEDEELYRTTRGKHGGPISLYKCRVEGCRHEEYK